jgi:hypothetical protein
VAAAWDIADLVLLGFLTDGVIPYLNSATYKIGLFQNDFTPAPGTVLDDFTACTFTGYAPQELASAVWGSPAVVDHVAMTTSADQVTFESDALASPQIAYGYYVTDADMENYKWCERFETPRTINPGDVVTITPRMKLQTLPAS